MFLTPLAVFSPFRICDCMEEKDFELTSSQSVSRQFSPNQQTKRIHCWKSLWFINLFSEFSGEKQELLSTNHVTVTSWLIVQILSENDCNNRIFFFDGFLEEMSQDGSTRFHCYLEHKKTDCSKHCCWRVFNHLTLPGTSRVTGLQTVNGKTDIVSARKQKRLISSSNCKSTFSHQEFTPKQKRQLRWSTSLFLCVTMSGIGDFFSEMATWLELAKVLHLCGKACMFWNVTSNQRKLCSGRCRRFLLNTHFRYCEKTFLSTEWWWHLKKEDFLTVFVTSHHFIQESRNDHILVLDLIMFLLLVRCAILFAKKNRGANLKCTRLCSVAIFLSLVHSLCHCGWYLWGFFVPMYFQICGICVGFVVSLHSVVTVTR